MNVINKSYSSLWDKLCEGHCSEIKLNSKNKASVVSNSRTILLKGAILWSKEITLLIQCSNNVKWI